MDAKLHAMTYIRNNKKRVAILIICLSLFIATQYGVTYFIYSNVSVSYAAGVNIFKKAAIVNINPEAVGLSRDQIPTDASQITPEYLNYYEEQVRLIKDKLMQNEHILSAYTCTLCNTTLKLVIGSWTFSGPLLNKEEISSYLDDMGAKLVEGTFPEQPGDLLLDRKLAANLSVKVGEKLGGIFMVTGLIDADIYMLTGIASDSISSSMVNNTLWLITDGSTGSVRGFLDEAGYSETEISIRAEYDSEMKSIKEDMMPSFDNSIAIITLVLAFVLCFCVLVVFSLHIRDRHEEWCLYQSIGFSAKSIYFLALKELLLCFSIAIIIGCVLACGILTVGELAIMTPKGLYATMFLPDTIVLILCLLVFLFGLLQFPLLHAISQTKTVDAIEDDIY